MENEREDSIAHACGASIQLVGIIVFLGGVSAIIVHLVTGERPGFLTYELSPIASILAELFFTLFGVVSIVHGRRIKLGDPVAAKWFLIISVFVFTLCVVHFVQTGKNGYEILFAGFMAMDGLGAYVGTRSEGVSGRAD